MNKPINEIDYDQLMLIAQGHVAFQLLWAGVQLDLFTILSKNKGMISDDIQKALKLQSHTTKILLVGLTSLGLLKVSGNKYLNTNITENYLVSSNSKSLIPVLGWQNEIVYKGLVDFVESLRSGTNIGIRNFPGSGNTLYERLVSQPKLEQIFQDAMSALSKQANQALLGAVDLAKISHLIDIGGGDGTNAIAIAKKYPGLCVTVFDSNSVCKIAKQNIENAGLSHRVNVHIGELFSTPFPDYADAFLFSHMFTIWSPEKNMMILKKAYTALPAGGMILIFNMMANDEGTGPISTALGSPYFLAIATGEGMLYSWSDYQSWLTNAGFTHFRRIEGLPMDHGLFIGIK